MKRSKYVFLQSHEKLENGDRVAIPSDSDNIIVVLLVLHLELGRG